jgi:predicted metalloprotease with PDZ domain
MMSGLSSPTRRIIVAAFVTMCGSSLASAQQTLTLNVDASQARMKILHASLSMPARPGPMTLVYPKWIPGEHMASGPISNLTGLHLFADGAELPWRRDLVDMNAFQVTVPAGARAVTATYDYVVPTGGGSFGTTASANAKCAIINWNTVALSRMGVKPDRITVTASLKLPVRPLARRFRRR